MGYFCGLGKTRVLAQCQYVLLTTEPPSLQPQTHFKMAAHWNSFRVGRATKAADELVKDILYRRDGRLMTPDNHIPLLTLLQHCAIFICLD